MRPCFTAAPIRVDALEDHVAVLQHEQRGHAVGLEVLLESVPLAIRRDLQGWQRRLGGRQWQRPRRAGHRARGEQPVDVPERVDGEIRRQRAIVDLAHAADRLGRMRVSVVSCVDRDGGRGEENDRTSDRGHSGR
jgi:hypothetical protein